MDKKSLAVLCLIFIVLSFSVSATGALIPTISKYFKQSPFASGALVWSYMLSYGVCALLWGPLTRRFSTKSILLFCLCFFSFSALAVSLAKYLIYAIVGRIGMGIFGSAFVPVSLIIIGKEIKKEAKSKYVGFLFALSFFASVMGIFLSGLISWRLIYFIPFVLGLLVLVLFNKLLICYDYQDKNKLEISYLKTFRNKNVFALVCFIVISSFVYHSIQQWLSVFLSQEKGFGQFKISLFLTISAFIAIFSEWIGGNISAKKGPVNVSAFGLFSMSVFLIMILSFSKMWVFFVVGFWGMGWAFNHVALSSILTHLPDEFLRDASSLNSSLRFFSGGLGAFFGGKMISFFGFSVHFILMSLIIVFLALMLIKTKVLLEGGTHAGDNR